MGKTLLGLLLLIGGGIALFFVYGMRPPEGLGDVARLVTKGQDYIKEPYYQVLMGLSAVAALVGLILFVVGLSSKK